MRTLALWIGAALGVLIAVGALAVVGIRLLSDGPIGILPGGPMSGELASARLPDFSPAPGGFVELQVGGWRPSSRTVLGFLHEGDLYVPSVYAESKWWPARVLEDPEVIVRHRGELYPRTAVRVTDPLLLARLHETVAGAETLASTPEMLAAETTWYFRLDPR